MLETSRNSLLFDKVDPVADIDKIQSPNVFRRKRSVVKRDIRDLRRSESAVEALAGFDKETQIYGFTKGQFSIIDILRHLVGVVGRCELVVSTWTAAHADVTTVLDFVDSGDVSSARWLVDLTFQRRTPALANRIRQVFGADSIRVAKNHAKFALIKGEDWRIVVHTSMNLNFNPRFENFTLAHDPELFQFHEQIIDELWKRQPVNLADAKPYDIHKFFDAHM